LFDPSESWFILSSGKLILPLYSYRYEQLGARTILPASKDLSFAFNTVTVSNISAAVRTGDLLGFSISGPDLAPYCHLEYDTKTYPGVSKSQTPLRLFVQGAGQNSWRGIDGKISVVYEREGKGVKFLAKVE
jgi:hypothetical protein